MAKRLTVAEFVGPPGVGKTRLLKGTIDELAGRQVFELPGAVHRWVRGRSPSGALRLLLRLLPAELGTKVTNRIVGRGVYSFEALNRFLLEHGDFLTSLVPVVRGRADALPERDLFLTWVLNLGARYQLATEGLRDRSILMLEEGFATRGVGLFAYGWTDADENAVRTYARTMPVPEVLIVVDAAEQTIKGRLDSRGWTRRSRHLSDADRLSLLDSARRVSGLIGEELEPRGTRVVRVRSEDGDDGRSLAAAALTGGVS